MVLYVFRLICTEKMHPGRITPSSNFLLEEKRQGEMRTVFAPHMHTHMPIPYDYPAHLCVG